MPSPLLVLGLDIGNTRLTAGVVEACGHLHQCWREDNPRAEGATATLSLLGEMIACAQQVYPGLAALGVGFGGPVDLATGTVRRSHHTTGWEGLKLAEILGQVSGLPVFLDNDANVGGLGEAWFGAGRGVHSLLYVNVGTGIGGAVILEGRVHHGAHSNAGEIGHVVIAPESEVICTCGQRGCLECLASGDALAAAARRRLQRDTSRESLLRNYPLSQITGREVSSAAQQGDAIAGEIMRQAGRYLGFAAAAACNVIDPELVVIGGGVSEDNPEYLAAAQQALSEYGTPPVVAHTRLVAAKLGYDAGVIGAATVALQGLNALQ